MARLALLLVLVVATVASILPPSSCQAAATSKCEYPKHAGHGYKHPVGVRKVVVDASGAGDFTSIQQAVDSVPVNNTVRVVMQINAGTYREKVLVPASKPYITFHGAGRDVTVVEWHDRASDRGPDGQPLRTYNTATVTILSNYFTAKNISFKNTAPAPMPGMEGGQAVAFRISGDKAFFFGCGFYGAQDTLCDDAGRHYFRDCYVEGSIDFVFGNARSLYKDCELHSTAQRYGSVAAHGRRDPCERTGFAFVNCRVTGTGRLYVGRAMGQYSRIVYAYTYFDSVIAPGGWDDWDHTSNKSMTAFFGMYRNWGPGVDAVHGVPWARELDYFAARPFLGKSFVNGYHWLTPDV
ncbi:hypothetical protein HU200_032770 [Digitaria exilis]|uniref:Pectinesterase n=1 Tax=Digitaria exilis TaxID=1010633 RepID=A0A835BY06_9POAL|nr:hypothetical protein HU200_032770 [Digitaria exilis]